MKYLCMVVFGSLAFAGFASAAITPALIGSPTVSGANFKWSYQISVDSLEQLIKASSTPCSSAALCGSFFTIYDFVGYVPGSVKAPAGWTAQVAFVGLTPSTQIPPDSPTIHNLTFVYTGATSPDKGPLNVSGFSAESTFGVANTGGTFTYQAEKIDSTVDAGIGPIEVPSSSCESDVYQATYFYNLGTGTNDASITILDPGVNAPANICANIYVLNPSEELEACCSVLLTPDEIVQGQLSGLVTNLLNNNGLVNGVVKIFSSTAGTGAVACPAGSTSITTTPDLRAWITRADSMAPFGAGDHRCDNDRLCTSAVLLFRRGHSREHLPLHPNVWQRVWPVPGSGGACLRRNYRTVMILVS